MADKPLTFEPKDRGNEHGSYIVEALETGRVYRGHFNVRNGGVISNLPEDCIIEAPGYVDGNGISMPVVGQLPLGCAAVCDASVSVQRLAVEAAVSGDLELLKQAMMMDPLTGAACNPPEIWEMADRMVSALAPWLPQYASVIPTLPKSYSLARFEGNSGAARLKTRSVDEIAEDSAAKKAAKESDKAGLSG